MKYPLPILEFRDTTGLDAPTFATFRLGATLAKSLKRGDRVLIVHGREAIGSARVQRVDAGNALDMLRKHALASHLELAGDQDLEAAVQRRLASLRKLYGPMMFNEHRKLSVIYLKRG